MEPGIKIGLIMSNNQLTSLKESYRIIQKIAGKQKAKLNRSFLAFILSYIFQGLAFAFFYPLLSVILKEEFVLDDAIFWFQIVLSFSLLSLIFRWYALNFSFTSDLSDVAHNLRLELGNRIKKIPLQRLNKYRTGELNNILADNVDESLMFLGIVAGMAFEALVVPAVIILTIFFIDLKMALAICILLPLSYPIYIWSRKLTKKEREDNQVAHAELEADTLEYFQGLPVLRSINQVGANSVRLRESIAKAEEVQKRGLIGSSIPAVVMNTLIEFIFLMILSLGTLWIVQGSFSLAALIALLVIVNRVSEPLANLLAIAGVLDMMEAGFKKIEELINIKSLQVNQPKAMPTEFDICFENVDFNYLDHENKALKNINLTIAKQSLTAIVGPSGSGKTTLTKLMMRYDDPSSGEIKIGGVDIRNMSQDELMTLVSVVFQDVYLLDDTILNNIRMGDPNASDDEVKEAAKKAHCHEFISKLPDGYNTKAGEIGGSFSGGERQRISIARAILKDAPIVILDEPTSALDTQSEVAVQKALDELIQNRTVIVIAHRLSTISHADNILVVDQGEIIEHGTHEELLEKQAKYYSMYQAQQRLKQWNLSHG